MTVRYSINFIDVFYGMLYFYLRSRTGRILGLILVIFIAVTTVPRLLSYDDIYMVIGHIVIVCGPSLGIMIAFLVITSIAVAIGNRKIYRDMSLQLSDAGIVHTMRGVRSEYNWTALERVVPTRRLIVLHIADAAALSVPRRAFTTEAEATQFLEYVSSRMPREVRRTG